MAKPKPDEADEVDHPVVVDHPVDDANAPHGSNDEEEMDVDDDDDAAS